MFYSIRRYAKFIGGESEEYYALIDNIEQLKSDQFEIILDGLSANQFGWIIKSKGRLSEFYKELTPTLFRIVLKRKDFDELDRKIKLYKTFGRRWIRLLVSKNRGYEIQQVVDDREDPEITIRYFQHMEFMSPNSRVAKELCSFFSWSEFSTSSENEILSRLQKSFVRHTDLHINVYNVGQGSLSSISAKDGTPIAYYDMGGGFAWNKSTYPNTLRLCWSKASLIILSHWDIDHLETARRAFYNNWNPFNAKTWLVPRQPLSPIYGKLAAHMASTGNLIVWPSSISKINYGRLTIFKCNGPHKNHSGLTIKTQSSDKKIQYSIHPGDSAYKYIKNRNKIIQGLVATHHGAEFPDNNAPVLRTNDGFIIYSYGNNNNYNHPRPNSVNSHCGANWNHREDTIAGHFSLISNSVLNATLRICGTSVCDICSLHGF